MRRALILLAIGCVPPVPPAEPEPASPPPAPPHHADVVVSRFTDFSFDGGYLEFTLHQDGDRVIEVAANHFAVPIVIAWQLSDLDNLEPLALQSGVAVLPAANAPGDAGPPVALTTLDIIDRHAAFHRHLQFHARFGDPDAHPTDYSYRLPFSTGKTFAVLQGFHGAFSHRGSNEYAVDFDCPVATHVLAARPGVVVAANAAAQGSGTAPEFLDYNHTNFVLVLHDDGTLGEYMHLAPSGVEVRPGQHVARGAELALSGNTGFSSTPHLHFQVMTAAGDGLSARSFPIRFAVARGRAEEPVQGRSYPSWE